MAEAAPLVSVIIPHYNDLEALRRCMLHLRRQTLQRDRFEVVVADNNSACGLDAVKEAVPDGQVVPAYEQGAGPARNAAVAASRGAILAFIDSDCLAEPDWLERGIAGLKAHDIVGGRVTVSCARAHHPTPVEAFEMVFNFDFRHYIEDVGFTGTGNMFTSRAVFDRVGPFRAIVAEDMEWSFRARAAGFTLGYVPDAVVEHPARQTWSELIRRWRRVLSEHHALALERPLGRTKLFATALGMPVSIGPHAVKIMLAPQLSSRAGRLGALKVLAYLRLWRMTATFRLLAGSKLIER